MSSNNIFLSISVFLNLVLLALFWVNLSDSNKNAADATKLTSEVSDLQSKVRTSGDQIALLQKKMGVQASLVGTEDDQEAGTVMGDANRAIAANGGDVVKGLKSFNAAVIKLRNEIDNKDKELDQKQKSLAQKIADYEAMKKQLTELADRHQIGKKTAEDRLVAVEKETAEQIDQKNQEITQVQTELQTVQTTLEKERADNARVLDELNSRLSTQLAAIRRLKAEKFEREDVSFEVADGRVVFVDKEQGVVHINIGRADGLRVGTTFSVYQKDNSGIARRNLEDIKAKIQVISVSGPRKATARILDPELAVRRRADEGSDDYYSRTSRYYQDALLRPIAANDPIYSPTFTRGEVPHFSVVGFVDLDGDGRSDRERFRNLVTSGGAKLDNEVDDEGNYIIQTPISYKTKFLVIADLGDQSKVTDGKRLASIQKINQAKSDLQEQAEDNGIRIVSLGAFLNYMGYQATASPWVKGEDYQTTLSAGAASDSVSGSLGRRQSQGNNSAIHDLQKRRTFNVNDRIGRKGTGGNVSGLYKDR